jgi:hypothetical protein
MAMSLASGEPKSKVRPDPIPAIRDAGKHIATAGQNADMCIRGDLYAFEKPGNPGTPEHMKKYRKSYQMQPGQIQVHPGLLGTKQNVQPGHVYGKP